MGYDRYPECLVDEKTQFLADKMARGMRLFFTHGPDCALADVARDKYHTANEQPKLELAQIRGPTNL